MGTQTKTLAEQVADGIMNLIQETPYKAGDKLPTEKELCESTGAGRNTVREALKILASRNVLEIRQGAGTFVSEKQGIPDDPLGFSMVNDHVKLTKDLLQVRIMLEPQIAALAAQCAKEHEIRELEEILEEMEADTEPASKLYLFQGLPKSDKMELIVQKSTELGAAAIAPVAMIRSVVKLEGEDAAKKAERWQKIAREAVKQCARVNAPEVKMPRKLAAMKGELNALDVLIVPWEDARDGSVADCLAPFAQKEDVSVGILIGPEGGIAPEEAEWLTREANAKLVTLGPRILRTETAAIASQTIVMALRGEME